ncbi:MAG: DUF1553 domain-containing protein [Gemmataceae bacterium]
MLRRLLTLIAFGLTAPVCADDGVVLLPKEFVLSGPESSQRLLVQRTSNGELTSQVTDAVRWESSNPAVATVADGVVTPMGDGQATITAQVGTHKATAQATVKDRNARFAWSFRNNVQPVLAKNGCNSGACHGALAGKGGFRLSLRGYDSDTDYFNIVKQDRGRRVELADPGRSLFLTKPSGAVRHTGGLRFETDSLEYRIHSEWVAAGAAPPDEKDPRVESLEILPGKSIHHQGEKQQMVVRARYSNGRLEDVTAWVKWSSANEAVCTVNDAGVVTVIGPGEGAVVAWYASKIGIARLTVPYTKDQNSDASIVVDRRMARNFIDVLIDKQLARLNLPASPACSDSEFVRRAYVDTIGRLPTAAETSAFLENKAKDKRDVLIDDLLKRPEFVDYWTYKWADILMLNGTLLRPQAIKAYYQWIHKHVEADTPWDEFVRAVITASGDSYSNGATNFYALHQSPEDMTENVSQAFLGLSIGCAKCHNHPLEKWTNDQYYAMANIFARVKAKGWGGEPRNGDGLRTLYVVASGELIQPRTGQPRPPTPLDGESIPFNDPGDRRLHLARWLTAPDNPYFARAITNRVWANFFGVGLVEAIDDMRISNPASNEELLLAAAKFTVEKKFDLKELMRAILQSNAYQRTSRPLPGNQKEKRFFSRYYPRRMMAEVMHDAIVQVTGVPTKFEFVAFPGADRQKTTAYPQGTRAIQLYDSAVENYFLQTFGRNQRRIVCECERSDEPSMVQVLHLANGKTINEKLKTTGNKIDDVLKRRRQGTTDEAILDEIYLMCLSRYPQAKERKALLELLPEQGAKNEREVFEDLFWGVLNSREFLFNH